MTTDYSTASGAEFSACGRYRWRLWRNWGGMFGGNRLCVIGLNPSTADEVANDPTVTRCINRAKREGFTGLVMLNLFGFRATDPAEMKAQSDPVGDANDWHLLEATKGRMVLCAWGVDGAWRGRARVVSSFLCWRRDCRVLGLTKEGHPRHPLYMPNAAEMVVWSGYEEKADG